MKVFKHVLFLLFIIILSNSNVNAQNSAPIPGINIIVKRNPPGIVFNLQTKEDGTFSTKLKAGKYDLSLSYDEIIKTISARDRNFAADKDKYDILLTLKGKGIKVMGDTLPKTIIVDRKTGLISLNVLDPETSIIGFSGFAIKDNGVK